VIENAWGPALHFLMAMCWSCDSLIFVLTYWHSHPECWYLWADRKRRGPYQQLSRGCVDGEPLTQYDPWPIKLKYHCSCALLFAFGGGGDLCSNSGYKYPLLWVTLFFLSVCPRIFGYRLSYGAGIATGLRARQLGFNSWQERSVRAGSGATLASYSMSTGGVFPWLKRQGSEADHSP
jgi:hypothetical protein